jgi:hypothetical protein
LGKGCLTYSWDDGEEAGAADLTLQQKDSHSKFKDVRPYLMHIFDSIRDAVNIGAHESNRNSLICSCHPYSHGLLEDQGY